MGQRSPFCPSEGTVRNCSNNTAKMLGSAARTCSMMPLSATAQAVPSMMRPLMPAIAQVVQDKCIIPPPVEGHTNFTLSSRLPKGALTTSRSIGGTTQVRFAHTDIRIPDFDDYRKESVKDATVRAGDSYDSRRGFTYLVATAGGLGGIYAGKEVVTEFISSLSASADVLALASIEIKFEDVPEGKSSTFKWRGKPLFIRHRTPEEIERERSVNLSDLRDPESDEDRTKEPEWLVLLGVCTHLGCVPIANAGDYGGYYCPCHGSHYDASGRIRKGPAPLNLEVPVYEFTDDTVVLG